MQRLPDRLSAVWFAGVRKPHRGLERRDVHVSGRYSGTPLYYLYLQCADAMIGGKEKPMGATYATVTIKNPADRARAWAGEFLVDTGCHDTFVPRRRLEAIGIEPEGAETYELADGSAVELDVAVARIEAMGRFGGLNVVFGDDHAEPLLGVIALETLGVEIDPRNECLRLLPAKRAVTPRRVRRRERGG